MLHRVEGSFNMFAYSDEIKEMIRTDTIELQNENKTVEEEKTDSEVADGATDEETKELKEREYSHPVYKQIAFLNGKINSYSKAELIKNLKMLKLDTDGSRSVLAKRLKTFYKKTMLNVSGIQEQNGSSKIRILFDFYVIIDYEATCELLRNSDFKQEIIEFPAVLLNCQKGEVQDEFRSYCRPVLNPLLTEFCTELTGITQNDVDTAPLFTEVLTSFEEWLQKKKLGTRYSFAIVTDGPWDMGHFLKSQCVLSNIEFPTYCKYWINIRKTFSNFYNTGKLPLSTMIQLIGREFQGRAHSGLDDARNIAFIVQRLLKDGARIIFNEKLVEGNARRRDDGNPFFSAPVHNTEFKAIQGKFRPNFPQKKSSKV